MNKAGIQRRIIVTRPGPDADRWVARLQQAGFNAQALPLIDIAAVANAADIIALIQACTHLHDYTACMFVSSNAVKHFFDVFSSSKVPVGHINKAQAAPVRIAKYLPEKLRFLAPGPGTRAALLAAGIPSSQIDAPPPDAAQFDSEALWQVVGQRNWRAAKVLVVRGKGETAATSAGSGREWLATQWRTSGATVDLVSSYERRAPCLSVQQIDLARAASCDGSIWLFSSSEAIANLLGEPGLEMVSWRSALAVATHPRIAAAAHAALWGVVRVSRPALPDIVQALASIESMPT